MRSFIKILLLEDVPEDAGLIERALRKEKIHFQSLRVDTSDEFNEGLTSFKPDIILSDHALPQFNSNEALNISRAMYPHIPFILVTGAVSEEFAVKILKLGADDYVLKSNLSRLGPAVIQSLRQRKLEMQKEHAEEALRLQNIELTKVNRELDNFVYNISHNLRAPLASAMGLLNLILIEKQNPLSLENYLDKARISLARLDNTLQEILDYSRNTRLGEQLIKIDLAKVIHECFEKLHYLNGFEKIRKNIIIRHKKDLLGDPYRLSLIFSNLISNSIKYMDKQKPVNTIDILAEIGDELVIEYSDNGVGIYKESVPHVFDMFYRGTNKSEGAGLGLYIVKEAIEKLCGSIQLESEERKGVWFSIRIPNGVKEGLKS